MAALQYCCAAVFGAGRLICGEGAATQWGRRSATATTATTTRCASTPNPTYFIGVLAAVCCIVASVLRGPGKKAKGSFLSKRIALSPTVSLASFNHLVLDAQGRDDWTCLLQKEPGSAKKKEGAGAKSAGKSEGKSETKKPAAKKGKADEVPKLSVSKTAEQ
eukprot:3865854-Rhodomonas_salina.1